MSEAIFTPELLNIVNIQLKKHPSYEEGMVIDSVKVINKSSLIHGTLNYPNTHLSKQEIQQFYLEVVAAFDPQVL
jgi:hypothetical protein